MKVLFISCLFYFNFIHLDKPNEVYICDSSNAIRYHLKSSCKGIKKCTYKIIKINLERAKKEGKTLCKYEK